MFRKPKNLKEYLEKSKKTRSGFAKEIGVTEDYIYKILAGTRTPSPQLAKLLNEITGIPLTNILYPNEDKIK